MNARTTAAGFACVALTLASSCGTEESAARLRIESRALGSIVDVDTTVASFRAGPMCLDKPGTVNVVSIQPVEEFGGARITDFSIFPMARYRAREGEMWTYGPLRDSEFFRGSKTVSEICPDGRSPATGFAVELTRPSVDQDAFARGLEVTYESDGERRTTTVRINVGLCKRGATECEVL